MCRKSLQPCLATREALACAVRWPHHATPVCRRSAPALLLTAPTCTRFHPAAHACSYEGAAEALVREAMQYGRVNDNITAIVVPVVDAGAACTGARAASEGCDELVTRRAHAVKFGEGDLEGWYTSYCRCGLVRLGRSKQQEGAEQREACAGRVSRCP